MAINEVVKRDLQANPKKWLVTGCAGFIGSNLVERLLMLDQHVVGVDNFSTGTQRNLDEVRSLVGSSRWENFRFIEGDIRHFAVCGLGCEGVDYVLHQAALGSVPRSIDDPLTTNANNVTGTLNMLAAAREAGARRFVYASSSAVYGDYPEVLKVEEQIGRPLSPYAISKYVCELYADQFSRHYGLECIGLRYFNVFGPRQNPNGPYAAVIPTWVAAMIKGEPAFINGTGKTSRDFCYVENVVQMNLLAATCTAGEAVNQVYNVAVNGCTTLNELFEMLRSRLAPDHPRLRGLAPVYRDFRAGDVMHSRADIGKAQSVLGYVPSHCIEEGLDEALQWYRRNVKEGKHKNDGQQALLADRGESWTGMSISIPT